MERDKSSDPDVEEKNKEYAVSPDEIATNENAVSSAQGVEGIVFYRISSPYVTGMMMMMIAVFDSETRRRSAINPSQEFPMNKSCLFPFPRCSFFSSFYLEI